MSLLEASLSLLEQLDIRVPDTGRHRLTLNCLVEANESAQITGSKLTESMQAQLQCAHRTAWETSIIAVAAFRAHRQTRGRLRQMVPFPADRLQVMMKGPFEYSHERGAWWDAQFELLMAAQLVLGGLEVRSGEPDIRFKYGHEWVGMACKRLTSLERPQMRRNIRKAAQQILRSGHRGWIATNLDSLLRDTPVAGRSRQLLRRLSGAFDQLDPIAQQISGHSDVLGVFSQANLSEWQYRKRRRPSLKIRIPSRWLCWEGSDPAATMFFRHFQQGWSARSRQAFIEITGGDITKVI